MHFYIKIALLLCYTIDNGRGTGLEKRCYKTGNDVFTTCMLWQSYAYKWLMHLTGGPTWLRSAIAEIKQ